MHTISWIGYDRRQHESIVDAVQMKVRYFGQAPEVVTYRRADKALENLDADIFVLARDIYPGSFEAPSGATVADACISHIQEYKPSSPIGVFYIGQEPNYRGLVVPINAAWDLDEIVNRFSEIGAYFP